MLGAWDVQQLLDRKYKIQETENAIKQQDAASAGLLRGAQARGLDVGTGLAPGLAKAEIAERTAQALGLTTSANLAPGLAASTTARNAAEIRASDAGIKLTNANVGRVGAETSAIRQLSPYGSSVFSRGPGMPKIDTPDVPTIAPPRPRPRLQDTLRSGYGFSGMP